jgi:hypothetical protein
VTAPANVFCPDCGSTIFGVHTWGGSGHCPALDRVLTPLAERDRVVVLLEQIARCLERIEHAIRVR